MPVQDLTNLQKLPNLHAMVLKYPVGFLSVVLLCLKLLWFLASPGPYKPTEVATSPGTSPQVSLLLAIPVGCFCVTSIAGRHIGIALAIVVVCVGVGVGGVGVVVVVRFSG